MKKKNRLLAVFLVAVVLLVGCSKSSLKVERPKEGEDQKISPEKGGKITVPLTQIKSLNPVVSNNKSYYYFSKLIYEPLFDYNEKFELENILVDSYEILNGGRTIKIELKDVKWHDGQSLKAEDVIFTLDLIKLAGPESIYGNLIAEGLSGLGDVNLHSAIEASGSGRHLEISFNEAYANNLDVLVFPILPSHKYESPRAALDGEKHPIGTGPFKFKAYNKLKNIELVRNDKYRGKKPYLDAIDGKIYKNQEDIIRAFETGQIDMTISSGTDWEKYGKTDRMKTIEYPSGNYDFLGWNFRSSKFQEEEAKTLRKALMYSLDREKLVDKVYLDHGVVTDLPLHPKSWLSSDKLKKYGHDELIARREFSKLGYKEKDGEGYLIDENGRRLSLSLTTNSYNLSRYSLAESIKQELKLVGVELIIPDKPDKTEYSQEEIIANGENVNKQLANHDLILGEWQFSPVEDLSYMFHSSRLGGENFIGYKDEETDRLIEEMVVSGRSREAKKNSYFKLGENLLENLPYLSICYKNQALVVGNNIHGDLKPSLSNPYRGIEEAFIKNK